MGDVPSKRSKPSGSRGSNDENATPPDAHHGAAVKQRRGQHGRTESPPLRPSSRPARAASPSDSGKSGQTEEDAGIEQMQQRERLTRQDHREMQVGQGDDIEDGLGVRHLDRTQSDEVESDEDASDDAEEFEPEEARSLLTAAERLNSALPRAGST